MFVLPQAGKAPRKLGRGVRPARPRMTGPVIPTSCQVLAVSGWRLGVQRGNGGLGEPRPTLITSRIILSTGPRVPVNCIPCPRANLSTGQADPHRSGQLANQSTDQPCTASAEPIPPHHDHRGGVEFAIAHELAADGATGGLIAGGEAVAEVLVGAHGAGAVLDDV